MEHVIQTRLNVVWAAARNMYPRLVKFPQPTIAFNNRIYRTAGRCIVQDNHIEISKKLFIAGHSAELLAITIPHEAAHQIDYNLNGIPKRWHHEPWKQIMRDFGLPPETYHNMDI